VIILGVDPSLRSTGYGLIEASGPVMTGIAYGAIHNAANLLPSRCLVRIHDVLAELIERHRPDIMAVEGLIYVQNTRIAHTLGQARGVAIAVAAAHGLTIYEYAPRKVKLAVTGRGGAGKSQVAHMVKAQLGLNELPPEDASDALAIALCHAQSCRGLQFPPPRPI